MRDSLSIPQRRDSFRKLLRNARPARRPEPEYYRIPRTSLLAPNPTLNRRAHPIWIQISVGFDGPLRALDWPRLEGRLAYTRVAGLIALIGVGVPTRAERLTHYFRLRELADAHCVPFHSNYNPTLDRWGTEAATRASNPHMTAAWKQRLFSSPSRPVGPLND